MPNKIIYALRITHIANIPNILKYGIVRGDSPKKNKNYVPIGDSSLITTRKSNPKIPQNSIPFYFGPRSPMLYVIQNGYNGVKQYKPQDIVYLVVRIDDIIQNSVDCVFTDGHAIDAMTEFYPKEKLEDLNDIVSFNDVFALSWHNTESNPDAKRRKEAEPLIVEDLSPEFIKGFVVYDKNVKNVLMSYGIDSKMIAIRPNYYY